MTRPQGTAAWHALANLAQSATPHADAALARPQIIVACGITLDLSRQRVTRRAMECLAQLAAEIALAEQCRDLVAGRTINVTEQRPVLHTLSRAANRSMQAFDAFVGAIREGRNPARSLADKRYTDVIIIGIGGSALGAQLAINALRRVADGPRIHFLCNIDGAAFDDVTAALSPLTTLVLVISKTFTTEETSINAAAVRAWLQAGAGDDAFPQQFVAITANPDEARRCGYLAESTFTFPVGVGGRFSIWSAVGLPIAISVGHEQFHALQDGACAMDAHFASAPFEKNLPLLLAAVGVWNRNFEGIAAHAILPYAERLSLLPKHLQQLEMESNGKAVDCDGNRIDYPTCPVIFGEAGTNGQHSFHQLLHQGTDAISSDIIIVRERDGQSLSQHQRLLAHAFAQANALWQGNRGSGLPAHQIHEGRRPVSLIELTRLDAFHLGALIALYEHKVFAQGVMWHLDSFDQWGVELGKTIAKSLLLAVIAAPADEPLCQHLKA